MRLPAPRSVILGVACVCLSLATGQQSRESSELKHLMASPVNSMRPVSLAALAIERGVEYPSVVKLKGDVRIDTPVCLPVGIRRSLVCDGKMIVRADQAEFDEKTGEIRAQGNIVVTPLQHEKK